MIKLGVVVLSATLSIAGSGAAWARSGVGLGDEYPQACSSGYHVDRGGNCQPDVAEVNRFCPIGEVVHSAFNGNGYICEAAPPEAY